MTRPRPDATVIHRVYATLSCRGAAGAHSEVVSAWAPWQSRPRSCSRVCLLPGLCRCIDVHDPPCPGLVTGPRVSLMFGIYCFKRDQRNLATIFKSIFIQILKRREENRKNNRRVGNQSVFFAQSCLTLCNHADYSPPSSPSMEFSRQE